MSSLTWFAQGPASTFALKSADGYYAIGTSELAGDGSHRMKRYDAYHIEALWAKPSPIGGGRTLAEAQQVCDQHRAAQRA
jgi:hypothetical protein